MGNRWWWWWWLQTFLLHSSRQRCCCSSATDLSASAVDRAIAEKLSTTPNTNTMHPHKIDLSDFDAIFFIVLFTCTISSLFKSICSNLNSSFLGLLKIFFVSFIYMSESCRLTVHIDVHICDDLEGNNELFYYFLLNALNNIPFFFSFFVFLYFSLPNCWIITLKFEFVFGISLKYVFGFESYLNRPNKICVTHWHQYNKSFWRRFIYLRFFAFFVVRIHRERPKN